MLVSWTSQIMNANVALTTILSGLQKESLAFPTLQRYLFEALAEVSKCSAAKTEPTTKTMFGLLIEVRMCICELACDTDLPPRIWKWYGWMERVVERMGAYMYGGNGGPLSDLLVIFFEQVHE